MRHFSALLLLASLLLISSQVFSQETETFTHEATVTIIERDIDFARSSAFQKSRQGVLIQAIEKLTGPMIFKEYRNHILSQNLSRYSRFLVSVKILEEYRDKDEFKMKLRGVVQMASLKESLRNLNIILQEDPWYEISLVHTKGLELPESLLNKRLELFHVRLGKIYAYDPSLLTSRGDDFRQTAETLFFEYPTQNVLLYLSMIPSDDSTEDVYKGMSFDILRKAGQSRVSHFSWNFQQDLPLEEVNELLADNTTKFINLFSLHSLRVESYGLGRKASFDLQVDGLSSSYHRSLFEEKILSGNRNIQRFTLKSLTAENANYSIQAGAALHSLAPEIYKKNKLFKFKVLLETNTVLRLKAKYIKKNSSKDLATWSATPQTVNLLKVDPETEPLREEIVPTYEEVEPNNNGQQSNFLPESTSVIGRVSSRADQDIYQLDRNSLRKPVIVIDWTRLGKTSLSPMLKLYDEKFQFLNSYKLIGGQDKLRIHYKFQDQVPKKVYLRVSDSIGFFPGDTGGFKSYYYLLQYRWEKGR